MTDFPGSIHSPPVAGWYIGRRKDWPFGTASVVVRVNPDQDGGVTTVWQIGSRDPATLDGWRLEAKVHSDGRVSDFDLDRAQKEAHADGVKQGREAAHRLQVEYEARRDRERPEFGAVLGDLDEREVGEPILSLRMSAGYGEDLSHGLSDLLCWARGFSAALGPDQTERAPFGIEWVRRVRETLTQAQHAAHRAKQP